MNRQFLAKVGFFLALALALAGWGGYWLLAFGYWLGLWFNYGVVVDYGVGVGWVVVYEFMSL